MSTIQQMLGMNGGSFKRAEKMALDMITKAGGQTDIWLDLALLLHAQGKVEGSRQALARFEKLDPDNLRLRFAQCWFKLYAGDLQGGLEHIEIGRKLGCLGERGVERQLSSPRWDGKAALAGKTILLVSEGGMGDQIMCVRSAKHFSDRGAKVVVDCSQGLMSLFSRCTGVTIAVNGTFPRVQESHDANGARTVSGLGKRVFHDYHLLAMSAFKLLDCSWETLWQGQYVLPQALETWERIIPIPKSGGLNVGLRWSGNPLFEHEQLRLFPPELLFKTMDIPGIKFWSLQKDDHSAILPKGLTDLEPLLSDWEQTAAAIARMDLVITSCTSIAHLAGAIGIPTWVAVPAMPYHPWAYPLPGRRNKWYPSVRLYRQKCHGDWKEVFDDIHSDLVTLSGRASAPVAAAREPAAAV